MYRMKLRAGGGRGELNFVREVKIKRLALIFKLRLITQVTDITANVRLRYVIHKIFQLEYVFDQAEQNIKMIDCEKGGKWGGELKAVPGINVCRES